MAIVKKHNKYYIVLYTKGQQHWITTGTNDKNKAEAMERDLRQAAYKARLKKQTLGYFNECAEAIAQEYQPAGIRFDTVWIQYLSLLEAKKLTPRSLNSKRIIWENLTKWLKKRKISHLQLVTKKIAAEFMQDKGGSGQTYNNIRNSLSSIFKAVRILADLSENPFEAVPTMKRIEHLSYRTFTDEELVKIFKAVTGEWYLACLIARYTGLRFKDIVLLKWENIDNERDIINLRPAKTSRYGKRTLIPIHTELKKEFAKIVDNNSEFLMPGLADKYETKDQQNYFGTLLDTLQIEDSQEGRVGFHSFRHTFNTKLEEAGVESATREKLSGHSSADINRIYSHSLEPLRDAIKKL